MVNKNMDDRKRRKYLVNRLPKRNNLILFLVFSQFLLIFPLFQWIVKKYLVHCRNINFTPGFRFLYGKIHADSAGLSNTYFIDYAPIYIGKNTSFGFDVMVITSRHEIGHGNVIIADPIHIGNNVWIYARSIILQGVTIGDNSIIAAGSVVTHNIPSNCLAGGNPANVIRYFPVKKRSHGNK